MFEPFQYREYVVDSYSTRPFLPVNICSLNLRNVLLVNSNADHLKVGDFGLSKLIKVQNSHDVYKMTGETGSCECLLLLFFLIKYDLMLTSFFLPFFLNKQKTGIWLLKFSSTGNTIKK